MHRVRHHRFAFLHREIYQVRNGTKWFQSGALLDVVHPLLLVLAFVRVFYRSVVDSRMIGTGARLGVIGGDVEGAYFPNVVQISCGRCG